MRVGMFVKQAVSNVEPRLLFWRGGLLTRCRLWCYFLRSAEFLQFTDAVGHLTVTWKLLLLELNASCQILV